MSGTTKAILYVVGGLLVLRWLTASGILEDDIGPVTRKLVPKLAQEHPTEAAYLVGKGLEMEYSATRSVLLSLLRILGK